MYHPSFSMLSTFFISHVCRILFSPHTPGKVHKALFSYGQSQNHDAPANAVPSDPAADKSHETICRSLCISNENAPDRQSGCLQIESKRCFCHPVHISGQSRPPPAAPNADKQ